MTVADPEILNALKWSHELDKVFRENYEEDKEILWQYFGSQTGFMRSFPGLLLQLDKYLQVAMLESETKRIIRVWMKNAMRLLLVSMFMGTDFWSGFLLQLVYGGQQKKWICMTSDAGLGLY